MLPPWLIQTTLGLILVFAGSESLIRALSGFLQRCRLPASLITLLAVAYGAQAPELATALQAVQTGSPDLASGLFVGSSLVNLLLLLGVVACVAPIPTQGQDIRKESLFAFSSAILLTCLCHDGLLDASDGSLLVIVLLGYSLRTAQPALDASPVRRRGLWDIMAYGFLGLALLFTGSDLLIDGALHASSAWGWPEAQTGLIWLAVVTSLPELVASIRAARRGHGEWILGSLLRGSVWNSLAIAGLCAYFTTIPVPARFLMVDLPCLLAATVVVTALICWRPRLGRPEGTVLIALYAAYIIYQYRM